MSVTKVLEAGLSFTGAFSGVLQTNANFVDQVIFGPAVDGVPWNGAWSKAGVFSSLMLATIEDEGSNTEINIWDLTEQAAGSPSTTPLATVDLSAAATPTAIAACMGYLIVGSEDGIAIIDPHSGVWAERTTGWPRTLSSSTTPALVNNDVGAVAAGLAKQPALDPRTGGPHPSFIICYNTGTDACGVIKDDGNLWNSNAYASNSNAIAALDHGRGFVTGANDRIYTTHSNIDVITADDYAMPLYTRDDSYPFGLDAPTTISSENGKVAAGHAGGLSILYDMPKVSGVASSGETDIINSIITRAYNTGFFFSHPAGIWLANSKTVDRSYLANTLTENGTVTEAAVASGAELNGYSGWSASNNLTRASDADWDVLGTGAVCWSYWFKNTGVASGIEFQLGLMNSAASLRFDVYMNTNGTLAAIDKGATAEGSITSGGSFEDSVWHKVDFVRVSSTERYLYVDGVSVGSNTTDAGSLSSSGNILLAIGVKASDGSSSPADNTTFALVRLSAVAPSATQVRRMYDAEKGMFVANAECLLQSGSTDAVLDVDVDKLTGKVLVTQTDAITVFDGLVVDSKPTVNSGASEKGKLWGDLRAEQNAANAYVTAPATDQRQVNEMVRGLASDLPKGIDLSKAKAWCYLKGTSTISIQASYNVKSITDVATGRYRIDWGVPFKSAKYVFFGNGAYQSHYLGDIQPNYVETRHADASGTLSDDTWVFVVAFGELENE